MTKGAHNSLGSLLQSAREVKNISLQQAANITKIPLNYLQAIEENNFVIFSSFTHARGFILIYAKYLDVKPERALALLRRDIPDEKTLVSLKTTPVKKNWRSIALRSLRFLPAIAVITAAVIFALAQVRVLLAKPALELNLPQEVSGDFSGEILVAGNSFRIAGKVSDQAAVFINSQPVNIDPTGEFESNEIPLQGDRLTMIVSAVSNLGRSTTINLTMLKASTGQVVTKKLDGFLRVSSDQAKILLRSDGEIKFNTTAFAGDVVSIQATRQIQLESDAPYNLEMTINGEKYTFTEQTRVWEIIDGKVIFR